MWYRKDRPGPAVFMDTAGPLHSPNGGSADLQGGFVAAVNRILYVGGGYAVADHDVLQRAVTELLGVGGVGQFAPELGSLFVMPKNLDEELDTMSSLLAASLSQVICKR